ncbi:hypothetical protein MD484_g3299, partial [Candolleomyces efflorescens]
MSPSTSSGKRPQAVAHAPFVQLPHELLFEIISLLSSTTDLLSLALTCSSLYSHVAPYHTEYRVLRVRTLNPTLFAHLARRTDLTRNIREVHISEKHNYTRGDRMPRSLVDLKVDGDSRLNGSGISGIDGERIQALNVCKALRCMTRLESFTWEWNGVYTTEQTHGHYGSARKRVVVRPMSEPRFEDAILAEVARKPTVKEFGVSGPFGMHVNGPSADNKFEYPVWHISNLTSLNLTGDTFLRTGNILPLCIMLSRSPNLECLTIPLEFKHLSILLLPNLKRVNLPLLSGSSTDVDESARVFVENHPGIEELSWYPIGTPRLGRGVLPRLRKLRGNMGIMRALAESDDREEVQLAQPAIVPAVSSQSSQPSTSGLLTVGPRKKNKRLSVIPEAEEAEAEGAEGDDGDEDDDGEATPPASTPLPLPEEDEHELPSPSSSSSAQYAPYSSEASSQLASPMITISAPPSTPTSLQLSSSASSRLLRPLESLNIHCLSASALLSLGPKFMDRSALRELIIPTFGSTDELREVARVFKDVRLVHIPGVYLPPEDQSPHPLSPSVDEIVEILPMFEQLEVVRGNALWRAAKQAVSNGEDGVDVDGNEVKNKVHEVLRVLARVCPGLKEVDHCDWYERRGGFKRVVVQRTLVRQKMVSASDSVSVHMEDGEQDVEEVELVSYSVRKPVAREYFDIFDGAFN